MTKITLNKFIYRIDINSKTAAFCGYQDEFCHDTNCQIPNNIKWGGNSYIVKSIAPSAFAFSFPYMEDLKLPDTLEYIGEFAFCGCFNLKSLVIPSSVIKIDPGAFSIIPLDKIQSKSPFILKNKDGVFSNGGTLMLKGPDKSEVIIPENVITIGNEAFKECYNIEQIVIPDSVRIIGERAFRCCENLEKIEIGRGVKEIKDYAFLGCHNLQILDLHALTPPKVYKDTFREIRNYETIYLLVNREAVRAYGDNAAWRQFAIL